VQGSKQNLIIFVYPTGKFNVTRTQTRKGIYEKFCKHSCIIIFDFGIDCTNDSGSGFQ
jgi:hypothetical protein